MLSLAWRRRSGVVGRHLGCYWTIRPTHRSRGGGSASHASRVQFGPGIGVSAFNNRRPSRGVSVGCGAGYHRRAVRIRGDGCELAEPRVSSGRGVLDRRCVGRRRGIGARFGVSEATVIRKPRPQMTRCGLGSMLEKTTSI